MQVLVCTPLSAPKACTDVPFPMWVCGAQVLVKTPVGSLQINSPLVGRQNVYNILAAVATGMATFVRGQPVPLKARALLAGGSRSN